MKAYAYFDQHGTLKEFIIDPSVRQGNSNVNEIMIYMEDDWNGYITGDASVDTNYLSANLVICTTQQPTPTDQFSTLVDDLFYNESIPTMKDFDPKYFKYGKKYNFIKYLIPSEALAISGNARMTLSIMNSDDESILAFGIIPFAIEESALIPSPNISWSEYLYLLSIANSIENKINKSGTTRIGTMLWIDTNNRAALAYNSITNLFKLVANLEVKNINLTDGSVTSNDTLYLGGNKLRAETSDTALYMEDYFQLGTGGDIKFISSGAFTWNNKNVATENYVVNITNALDTRITAIEDVIPTGASSSNKLVTESFVTSALTPLANRVTTIESYIPSQTSASNQLADKAFVNSSISTNTADFLGTYNVVTDLGLTISATHTQVEAKLDDLNLNPTNNDYVFVSYPDSTDPTQYTKFERYKYSSSDNEWRFEYELNNSSFTSAQWAAISSGITAAKVAAYDAHLANTNNPHGVTASQVGLGNVDNTSDATKKANFTGSIASGNNGFATGGDVYDALALKADITYVDENALAMSVVNNAFTEITIEED